MVRQAMHAARGILDVKVREKLASHPMRRKGVKEVSMEKSITKQLVERLEK